MVLWWLSGSSYIQFQFVITLSRGFVRESSNAALDSGEVRDLQLEIITHPGTQCERLLFQGVFFALRGKL